MKEPSPLGASNLAVPVQADAVSPDLKSLKAVHSYEHSDSNINQSLKDHNSPSVEDGIMIEGEVLAEDADEETRLRFLTTGRDQDDLERDIGRQADQMLTEQADERDKKRLEKTQKEKQILVGQIKQLQQRLLQPGGSAIKNKIRNDIAAAEVRIETLDTEVGQIQKRIDERHTEATSGAGDPQPGNKRLPNETRRDFLIRTGKITPFSNVAHVPKLSANLGDVMLDAEEEEEEAAEAVEAQEIGSSAPMSHRNLMKPGFADDESSEDHSSATSADRPTKRRKTQSKKLPVRVKDEKSGSESPIEPGDEYVPDLNDKQLALLGESDDGEGEESDEDFSLDSTPRKRKATGKKKTSRNVDEEGEEEDQDLAGVDDGNEQVYQARLQSWIARRSEARQKAKAKRHAHQSESGGAGDENEGNTDDDDEAELDEWHKPHPSRPDGEIDEGYHVPGDIYPSLFDYQKTGVQWLWELYSQQVGGIIGDEMGLGKTIQIISFIAGLHYSKKLTRPIIIVTPATVMKQWVNEFHRWWPPLRVSILHTSGSGMMNVKKERELERELESRTLDDQPSQLTKSQKAAKKIVDKVLRDGHVLITTYSGLQTYARFLIPITWEYAVLDEGHKIRNPNTSITIYCKELRTPNRVILSGTPMQNNLTELWSLFDFVFPMRLGTLVTFRTQFEFPIKQGGYASASNLQVETAMRCAETLKETISGYLLQRFKVDVAADLPKKTERVLFCKLTKLQREAYENFLVSPEMKAILASKRKALFGVDILRKICNHPDLVYHKTLSKTPEYNYGASGKSGKMQVVKALLEMWKKNGHKALLFAQHRIMLDILEKSVKSMQGFNYRRMDGSTAIKDRQTLVDEFNNDPDLHVFLLTTKVGGLGVNLTGANRIIIFDPDWNPSTDVQARERAWRLGQKREVEIYRLMTAGTIEEKIYHRQIFKQFLTNKILKDPKQRQKFQLRDLHDLFAFGDSNDGETETGAIFQGTEVKFNEAADIQPEQPSTASENPGSIVGVSRQEDYQTSAEASGAEEGSNKDERLLSTIFARSGVHSALEHDAIINSNSTKPKVTADPEIIAKEARRIADEAARELRRAGEMARTVPAGTPTWTGLYGSAGRPESPAIHRPRGTGPMSRGGFRGASRPSSASIIANYSNRASTTNSTSAGSSSNSSTSQTNQPTGTEFMALIRDYLITHGGKVYTQMLVDHFNRFCGTPQRTTEFKEMLKRIAVLEKGSRGRGRWVLKDEFMPSRNN